MYDLFGNLIEVKIKRKYYNYTLWEDYQNGMYKRIDKKEQNVLSQKALNIMKDYKLFGKYMNNIIINWHISCRQNLTDPNINQKAWLGQAALCYAIGCPEYITRKIWSLLSNEERDNANREAIKYIKKWELMQ